MSDWKKVENKVGTPAEAPEEQDTSAAPEEPGREMASTLDVEFPDAEPAAEPAPALSPRRYNASGRRRGRTRYAAPLGLLVTLLALVGVAAIIWLGVYGIRRATDDTAIKTEIFDFITPLVENAPVTAFTDVNESQQDALILSAIWKVTNAESIRMQREGDDVSQYAQTSDGTGRIVLPLDVFQQAYTELYGPDATPNLHTIGEEDGSFSYKYVPEENCYYVPMAPSNSRYETVADTLTKKGRQYTLRVCFVPVTSIGIDEKGNPIEPTPDMAEYAQLYTVERLEDDAWKIVAVADE